MFSSLLAIVPMLCVVAAGVAAMLAEALRAPGERMPIAGLGIVGLVGAGVTAGLLWDRNTTSFGVVSADNFGLFITVILAVVGILTTMVSSHVVGRDHLPAGEYYALTLFAISGMMLMATAVDLVVIFLALEVLSLAVYVLTAIRRDSEGGTEGAFKYFVLGGFSSAFFVYGIAFTYGIVGSTRLDRIGAVLSAGAMNQTPLALVALSLLMVGFAFKVSAVPFHMWTPDAYEGAPAIVTGFMSTGVKAAAFAAFARVFLSALEPLSAHWTPVLWAIAAATMILGTVVGVAQRNLKRMLAYSSIAHGGYLLVALVAARASDVGKAALLFYLAVYAVTNLAAFAVIACLGTRSEPNDELPDYAGLGTRRPMMAAAMTVFLLSLGGMPPTAGFVAKWYVFSAAIRAGDYSLAIIGVLTSVIAVFFYLRVVVMMYMAEPGREIVSAPASRIAVAALATSLALIFYLGILPGRLLELAAGSVASIF
jgi:NADH-quinone oxidoreductase subunit N